MWQYFADTGGTFTDFLALAPDGTAHRAKVLSSGALRATFISMDSARATVVLAGDLVVPVLPTMVLRTLDGVACGVVRTAAAHREGAALTLDGALPPLARGTPVELTCDAPAPVLAARVVTQTPWTEPLPAGHLRLATTRGTNALLERRGAPTVLVTTRGFGDLLHIGDQTRRELFALAPSRPAPLVSAVIEADERCDARGTIVRDLDDVALRRDATALHDRGVRGAAIVFLHAWRNDHAERRAEAVLRDVGFETVVRSSALRPTIGLLDRARLTEADAWLTPVIASYLAACRAPGAFTSVDVMTSAGGIEPASTYRAVSSVLSGPAGGVAGAAAAARQAGLTRVIGFDMGGTSTDVARIDGDFVYRERVTVGETELALPALEIETVAAGGGSICRCDGARLRVGPESAGAHPGPACYGAGGPLTLTDVNLLLGRIDAARFNVPISIDAAREALRAARSPEITLDDDALLHGFLDVADERTADAIRRTTAQLGIDPAAYALVAFGGAGAQHACAVAARLGITCVLVPADASLLSAYGLLTARRESRAERAVLETLDACGPRLAALIDAVAHDARQADGAATFAVRRVQIACRLAGQEDAIVVESARDEPAVRAAFTAQFRERFGYAPPDRAIEVVRVVVIVSDDGGALAVATDAGAPAAISGPASIAARSTTIVVPDGWCAQPSAGGAWRLESSGMGSVAPVVRSSDASAPDAVRQTLFTNGLTSLAAEMGDVLARVAISTNVRDRRDFSCAILDADGALVVNAPHIPVHLGALGQCVRAVATELPLEAGDVVVTNHPAYGGSHLPDVTVITPIVIDGALVAYAANRAHHAEIGGTRAGSMPPFATTLAEEGVVIPPTYLVRRGESRLDDVMARLRTGPGASRAPDDNAADLQAQIAANQRGVRGVHALVERFGRATARAALDDLQQRAESLVRRALADRVDGVRTVCRALDDGTPIVAQVEIAGSDVVIDFTGSGPVHPGNLNATPAIVASAVMYVLRLLAGAAIPLNEGLLRPVTLVIPEGVLAPRFVDDPRACPAVVGGNVETSQRIVNVLLEAFDLSAASPATMNNLLFGTERFGYYETIAHGAGATATSDGADAVQTHMTNTRMTDAEIFEQRYPVTLERFAIRRGSGGAGTHGGGDGVERVIRAGDALACSLVTQQRSSGAPGVHGGHDGAPGEQFVQRGDGTRERLDASAAVDLAAGDVLTIRTPGGGGWGMPPRDTMDEEHASIVTGATQREGDDE